MAGRKMPKEVQAIFDKYIHNNVRRLKRPEAVHMMCNEFSLTEEQANEMFDSFDRDHNGVMSIWEFQAFYASVGSNAAKMVEKFKELDTDGSGKLDRDEAKKGLLEIDMSGRKLEEREVDFFIRSSVDDNGLIDLGHFANLLSSLKMYKQKLDKEHKK